MENINKPQQTFLYKEAQFYWTGKLSGDIYSIDVFNGKISECNTLQVETYHLNPELIEQIKKISKDNKLSIYTLLLTCFKLALYKFYDNNNIIISTPPINKDTVNKFLIFQDTINDSSSFKQVLLQVRQTVLDGFKYSGFPLKDAFELLDIEDENKLNSIAFVYDAIQETNYFIENQKSLNCDLLVIVNDDENGLNILCNYYGQNKIIVDSLMQKFEYLTKIFLFNIEQVIGEVKMLSEHEEEIINNSNKTQFSNEFSNINSFINRYVNASNNNIALLSPFHINKDLKQVTYSQLNLLTNKIANYLILHSITANDIVALLLDDPVYQAIFMLGVLKAGAAYLPINSGYSKNVLKMVLKDCNCSLLITDKETEVNLPGLSTLPAIEPLEFNVSNQIEIIPKENDLAYVIYSSGSTGKPKGILVNHRNLANYVEWRVNYFNFQQSDKTLQLLNYAFDGYNSNFYATINTGATLILPPSASQLNIDFIKDAFLYRKITNLSIVPGIFKTILIELTNTVINTVRFIVLAGDVADENLITNAKEIFPNAILINEYGPTETTVASTANRNIEASTKQIIGKPIFNNEVFILNKQNKKLPLFAPGEICISGKGVSRGYLNNVELTDKLFINSSEACKIIYKTGDIGIYNENGEIIFCGRRDNQVKVRGFRINTEEVENSIKRHVAVDDCAILIQLNNGENEIHAYIVKKNAINKHEIINYLNEELPSYMVPDFVHEVNFLPKTLSGKVDRKSLLDNVKTLTRKNIIGPRNETEEKLIEIWSSILNLTPSEISVTDSFFDIGGHSLNVINLNSILHKEFNVKFSISDIFKLVSIENISNEIKKADRSVYVSITKVPNGDSYNLSKTQQRLYLANSLVKETTAYNVVNAFKLKGKIDKERLEYALNEVICRHRILRSFLILKNDQPYQKVENNIYVPVTYYDKYPSNLQDLIKPFNLFNGPLLRCMLFKESDDAHLLILDISHILIDGHSVKILINELVDIYHNRRNPAPEFDFIDFVGWEHEYLEQVNLDKQIEYWKNKFRNELPLFKLPYDYKIDFNIIRKAENTVIEIDTVIVKQLNQLLKNKEYTFNMLLLAAYYILLFKLTGQSDIIVGSVITERKDSNFDKVIGVFVNLLALRTKIDSKESFSAFISQVKNELLGAYENQNVKFEDITNELDQKQLFNTVFSYENFEAFNIYETNFQLEALTFDNEYAKYDLSWQIFHQENKMSLLIEFSSEQFKLETINRFAEYYINILKSFINNQEILVKDIQVYSVNEYDKLVNQFAISKDFAPGFDNFIHSFNNQLIENKNRISLSFKDNHLSYNELNIRVEQFAKYLISNGVKKGDLIGLLLDRSENMIISILGVLKSGAGYLPIDPKVPQNRLELIIADSRVRILITEEKTSKNYQLHNLDNSTSIKNNIIITKERSQIQDLDTEVPIPDRSLIKYKNYDKLIGMAPVKNCISIQATRGCPYKCIYCHKIWPNKYVYRSAENIFEEINLYYQMGVKRFALVDDIFNLDYKNSTRFFELLIKNNLKINLFLPSGLRADILKEEYIDLMVEAGVVGFPLSLETASKRLQKLIKKNLDIDKLYNIASYITAKYPHIILDINTMHGFPTETEQEATLNLDFIKSIKWFHFPFIHVLKIWQNTEMAELAIKHGISEEEIESAESLAYHELPAYLPFSNSFTKEYQSNLLNDYFFYKERLLHVLPHQMKIMTEEEIVQKYNSFSSYNIANFDEMLSFLRLKKEDIKEVNFASIKSFNEICLDDKIEKHFKVINKRVNNPKYKVLLLDLSQLFDTDDKKLYDVAEAPLGLLYLLSYLKSKIGESVDGKIAKSKIDFKNYHELSKLIQDYEPDLIGLRTLTLYKDFFHTTVGEIRRNGYKNPIICGGPYATSDYTTVLSDPNIDIVVKGEGERTFFELVKLFMGNENKIPSDEKLSAIDGIVFLPNALKLKKLQNKPQIVIIDKDYGKIFIDREVVLPELEKNDLAYVIYTSGSTGKPKGTVINHGNFNRIVNKPNFIKTGSNDNFFQISNYSFDGSIFEIFAPLAVGGRLRIASTQDIDNLSSLGELILKDNTTVSFLTTALANALFNNDLSKLKNLRKILFGGEKVTVSYIHKAFSKLGDNKLIHVYGPTESTVYASYYPINHVNDNEITIPIGKPVSQTKLYILDKKLKPSPIGVIGEIYIGGNGISVGYLNNPEKTAKHFIVSPFNKKEILYRTGDLGRWLSSGDIEFFKREDDQIKLRGYRIELSEIEFVLERHTNITKAIVLLSADEENKQLLAFYSSKHTIEENVIKSFLSNRLPEYMIPNRFIRVDKFPLNKNDKIDKHLLLKNFKSFDDKILEIEPRNEVETCLHDVWCKIFSKEKLSITQDFFSLGGDSIKTIQMISGLNEIGYKLDVSDIYRYQSIAEISPHVRKIEIESSNNELISGEILLTPIQKWFFESDMPDKHWFNHAVKIKPKVKLSSIDIQNMFNYLYFHHDNLRSQFKKDENNKIIQFISIETEPLQILTYQLTSDDTTSNEYANIWLQLQNSFDLENGPLIKIALLQSKLGDTILVIIHHLIIDGISWRIIFEDLNTLIEQHQNGKEYKLPRKTESFQQWSNRLTGIVKSEKICEQIEYWKNCLIQPIDKLKNINTQGYYVKDEVTVTKQLSENYTRSLLHDVNQSFNTEINEILLAALGYACTEVLGLKRFFLSLEGHGREKIVDADVNRTIGWFTSIFPVYMNMDFSLDLSRQMREIKDNLRKIPSKGIGYGILKYLTPETKTKEIDFLIKPAISFNYLGQFNDKNIEAYFEISDEEIFYRESPENLREHPINFNSIVKNDQLTSTISFSNKQYEETKIQLLLDKFYAHLENIINYCINKDSVEIVPSDFKNVDLSIEDLDSIFD